jgi:phosphoribosylamine--glycine ligase
VDPQLADEIENTVMRPTLDALAKRGTPYVGILYAGLMIADDGPRVVEFNCRLGDPEAQAILPLLDGDFAEVALLAAEGRLEEARLRIDGGASCCVVVASGGYPGKYATGHRIAGVAEAGEYALVFQAGTAERDGTLKTAGGRVLSVVGQGENLGEARSRAYEAIGKITFSGAHHRTDIAATDPERIPA